MRTRRCHRHRLLSCCGWFWCWLSTTVSLHHHHVQAQEPHVASTTTTRTLPPLVPLDPQDAKHWASLAAAAGEPSLFEDKASVASSSPHHHRPLRNTVSSTRTLHWRSSKPTSAPTRVPTSMAPTLANGETTTTQIPLFCSTAPNDGGLQCLNGGQCHEPPPAAATDTRATCDCSSAWTISNAQDNNDDWVQQYVGIQCELAVPLPAYCPVPLPASYDYYYDTTTTLQAHEEDSGKKKKSKSYGKGKGKKNSYHADSDPDYWNNYYATSHNGPRAIRYDWFCVQGGTCRTALDNFVIPDDMTAQPCVCPPGVTGKHCEFATMTNASSHVEQDTAQGRSSNGTTTATALYDDDEFWASLQSSSPNNGSKRTRGELLLLIFLLITFSAIAVCIAVLLFSCHRRRSPPLTIVYHEHSCSVAGLAREHCIIPPPADPVSGRPAPPPSLEGSNPMVVVANPVAADLPNPPPRPPHPWGVAHNNSYTLSSTSSSSASPKDDDNNPNEQPLSADRLEDEPMTVTPPPHEQAQSAAAVDPIVLVGTTTTATATIPGVPFWKPPPKRGFQGFTRPQRPRTAKQHQQQAATPPGRRTTLTFPNHFVTTTRSQPSVSSLSSWPEPPPQLMTMMVAPPNATTTTMVVDPWPSDPPANQSNYNYDDDDDAYDNGGLVEQEQEEHVFDEHEQGGHGVPWMVGGS